MKNNVKNILIIFLMMAFIGCSGGSDNAYDGETGLITGTVTESNSLERSIESIFTQIILKDAKEAYTQSLVLGESIETLHANVNEINLQLAQDAFKKLTLVYKRVEAVYVAGYNDDNMRDIADFYLENFIKGSKSQDIAGDLERVFAGEASLVKNSLKGITALEYTLFGENEDTLITKINAKRTESAITMITKISSHLLQIEAYYTQTSTFSIDGEDSVSALLNVLSQQAYNLRELRIGDAAGFTIKYKDSPLVTRLEYHRSLNSLAAIQEILKAFKTVMDTGLNNIATLGDSSAEAYAISSAIDEAISITKSYPSTLESALSDARTLELYETIRTIQNNVTALINGLNFKQDIIDADGD